MAGRVVLHVGAPKSGTTYVQSRLQANAAGLRRHDVLVPRGQLAFRAALDLTGVRLGRGRRFSDGRWRRLTDAVGAHPGLAVVSDEALVRADDDAAARAVADLRAGGAEVDVVYTARDLARQLVSGWLEGLKHGGTEPLASYVARAEQGGLKAMRAYDLPTVLARWGDALGDASRVHLVTVPGEGGDRSLLWTRFLDVAGVDPAWTPEPATRSNDAVGLVEAQLLRLVNQGLDGGARRGGPLHGRVRQTTRERASTSADDLRVVLDPAHAGWVEERTEAWLDWVRHSGIDVVGDLDELRPVWADPAAWRDPDVVSSATVAAAAAALAAVQAGAGQAGRARSS